MIKIFYLIGKSATNIVARPLSAITSFLSLLLLLLMFDMVWISSLSAERYYERIAADIDMEIFLDDTLADSTVSGVLGTIVEMDGVADARYISKEKARDKLYSLMGADLLDGLEDNPLPRSVIITFENDYRSSANLATLKENLNRIDGVSEIYYPEEWLEKIEMTRGLIFKIVVFLGIVISLAVVLNLLHSIRLSARSRGQEILQHRLLGAGKFFISIPYILEGLFYSLAAAAAGWLINFYAFERLTFRDFEIIFPDPTDIVYFCAAAGLIGLFGGYAGIRRSLR